MENAKGRKQIFAKRKLERCVDWLQEQNKEPQPLKTFLQKNDNVEFISEFPSPRRRLSLAPDIESIPAGINEDEATPVPVSVLKLRFKNLILDCEWESCRVRTNNNEEFHKHVATHVNDVQTIEVNNELQYICLWDSCGQKTADFSEMVLHINYHSYHAKLLAIGFNGRATLQLGQCKRDSSKRNQLPIIKSKYSCMWVGCGTTHISIQSFFEHVDKHIRYADKPYVCSWGGCGTKILERRNLRTHLRSHTGERHIACYHCGAHFYNNRKLLDHISRQNVEGSGLACRVCGAELGSAGLLREHQRQHVALHACHYCDLSVHSRAVLAQHVRDVHVRDRPHPCPHCAYRSKRQSDLRTHMKNHIKIKNQTDNYDDVSDEEQTADEVLKKEKKKEVKKYCCHMCPTKKPKIFLRGTRLTTHLVRQHGVQWPCGHSRFRYQISEDGMYRLTTIRYESLEVSRQIMERKKTLEEPKNYPVNIKVLKVQDATMDTPMQFRMVFSDINSKENKGEGKSGESERDDNDAESDDGESESEGQTYVNNFDDSFEIKEEGRVVEVTVCDVDKFGNIVNSEVVNSKVVFNKIKSGALKKKTKLPNKSLPVSEGASC